MPVAKSEDANFDLRFHVRWLKIKQSLLAPYDEMENEGFLTRWRDYEILARLLF